MGDDRPRIEKGVLCKRTRKLAIEEIKQNLPLPKILKFKILRQNRITRTKQCTVITTSYVKIMTLMKQFLQYLQMRAQ